MLLQPSASRRAWRRPGATDVIAGSAASRSRPLYDVALSTAGGNAIRTELPPNASDENLDGIAVRLAVARVDVLAEFALRDDPPLVVDQISDGAEFERRQWVRHPAPHPQHEWSSDPLVAPRIPPPPLSDPH